MMQGPDLLNAYLNGEDLTPQQGEALSAWICSSDENSRHAAVLMHLNQSVAEAVRGRNAATLMSDDADPHWVNFFGQDNADQVQAKPFADERPPIHLDANALTKEKYLSALRYVLKHTFTPKRVATLAAAAVLVIGTALTIVLMTGPQSQEHIADNTPQNKPAASTQPTPRGSNPQPVATLTAQHNATWGRPASAGPEHPPTTGSKLHPNQRLTLTAGFAEITTARGAIAILQAPATIEFTTNNNALRLHTGKLVGICETESSKGFLVRTPHMDITDLGTRFGVDATQTDATEVHVFEGEVELARVAGTNGVTEHDLRLTSDEAVAIDAEGWVASVPAQTLLAFTGPDGAIFSAHAYTQHDWRASRRRMLAMPEVVAFVPFFPPSANAPKEIGVRRLRMADLEGQEMLGPRDDWFGQPIDWRGDRGFGQSLALNQAGFYFIDLDVQPGGAFDSAGLLDDNGLIGRPGTTIYITWRMQGDFHRLRNSVSTDYAGLSLMFGDQPLVNEHLFAGKPTRGGKWGLQIEKNPGKFLPDTSFAPVDATPRLFMLRMTYGEQQDLAELFIDPDLSLSTLPEPVLSIKNKSFGFDRLRFGSDRSDLTFKIDDVSISTTPPNTFSGAFPGK